MYGIDYAALGADLVVNTSCEHIADLRGWLDLLPRGTHVLLQSNDYFSEPTPHQLRARSLEAFERLAGLAELRFSGSLPTEEIHALHADRRGLSRPPARSQAAQQRGFRARRRGRAHVRLRLRRWPAARSIASASRAGVRSSSAAPCTARAARSRSARTVCSVSPPAAKGTRSARQPACSTSQTVL